MGEVLVGLAIFLCLLAASLGVLLTHRRMPSHHRDDDTTVVVRLIANIFVVLTSLVLGLMINSSRNTFEEINRNVHALAAQSILLDRMLDQYGPEADPARKALAAYIQQALDRTWPSHGAVLLNDPQAEQLLGAVGGELRLIEPKDSEHMALWQDARQQFLKVLELRWTLVQQADDSLPAPPFVVMVVAWLVLIFASFGYRAPGNPVVITLFVVSAALIATAIYLIIDMERPFTGPIHISPAPLERALAAMRR